MTDYIAYRKHVGITNPEMTDQLQQVFPSFNKVAACYVNKPKEYGVCLLPEAEQLLISLFGPGPGLESLPWQEQPKKKRSNKRRKNNSITFRMDDELWQFAQSAKAQLGCETWQQLMECLLVDYIRHTPNRMGYFPTER